MSLNSPIEPDAARPESVEPVTLSDRVNAVINPTANPSSAAAAPTASGQAQIRGKNGNPAIARQAERRNLYAIRNHRTVRPA